LGAVRSELARPGVRYSYDELDPDIFADDLRQPAYANVERIAAVFLQLQVSAVTSGRKSTLTRV
jgi:hypothetical protein